MKKFCLPILALCTLLNACNSDDGSYVVEGDDDLNVSTYVLNFESTDTATHTVTVTTRASHSWTAGSTSNWLILTNAKGVGNGSFTVQAAQNDDTDGRQSWIRVSGTTIEVHQAGAKVDVDTKTLFFAGKSHLPQTVNVTATGDWTATTEADWLILTGAAGSRDGKFSVQAADNTGSGQRTGTITLRRGRSTVNVNVTQLGKDDTDTRPFTVAGHGITTAFLMKRVEAGTFQMGSYDEEENERPIHQVTLTRDYYLAQAEVTQALWQAVMGSTPVDDANYQWTEEDGLDAKSPAYNISYDDCLSFITRLNALCAEQLGNGEQFRLPTEAEWEFAARGGKDHQDYARLGLHEMIASKSEWCLDWLAPYPAEAQTDPAVTTQGDAQYRVLRGGMWIYGASTITFRSGLTPSTRLTITSLRLAL